MVFFLNEKFVGLYLVLAYCIKAVLYELIHFQCLEKQNVKECNTLFNDTRIIFAI